MDLNHVSLVGTVTEAPAARAASPAVSFSLTTVRREERFQEIDDIHRVVTSGKLAEVVGEYVKRGSRVFVGGRLEDGTVVAERLILLGQPAETEAEVAALTAHS